MTLASVAAIMQQAPNRIGSDHEVGVFSALKETEKVAQTALDGRNVVLICVTCC